MRKLILLMITLGLAVSARADVSDSGNLTIGGTGVIQGTMTVQGAAFSVGGTTFSVAGGSVTLGGRLNVAATGIKWADGTESITASPSGASVLNATQTFSGANTFTSSVTVGVSGYSNVLDYSRIVKGMWSVVAYSSFTAATSIVYTNFNSSYSFRANIRIVQNTSNAFISYLPQGDTGSTHTGYMNTLDSVGNNYSAPNVTGSCPLASAANSGGYILAGNSVKATLEISAVPGNTKLVDAYARSTFYDVQSARMNFTSNCGYVGTTDFNSVTFNTSAGTITGFITWEALWTPQVQ